MPDGRGAPQTVRDSGQDCPDPDPQQHVRLLTSRLDGLERRAKTLAELTRLLSAGCDPLVLAQRATDLVMSATGATGTYVYRWDPELERLVMSVAKAGRVTPALEEVQLRLGQGLNGWSALTRQTVVVDDTISEDERFVALPGVREDDVRSTVVAPIAVADGELLGVFGLLSQHPQAFDRNAVELATEVGELLAGALIHAQTVEELRRASAAARLVLDLTPRATSVQRCVEDLAAAVREIVDADLCVVELVDAAGEGPLIRPGLAFADRIDREIVFGARTVASRAGLQDVVQRLGPPLRTITSAFGALSPEGVITCHRRRPFDPTDTAVLEAVGAQAAPLLVGLRERSLATPLTARLTAAGAGGQAGVLRDLGWRSGPTRPVVVSLRPAARTSPAVFDDLVRTMRRLVASAPSTVLVAGCSAVTVLVPYEATRWDRFEQGLLQELQGVRTAAPRSFVVGVGPVVTVQDSMAAALDGAESAAAWAELLEEPVSVVRHDDVGHLGNLPSVLVGLGAELRALVDRFGAVVHYDRRHGTELADTLDCYLASRCSAVETARTLIVHRNTLRQRLSRIEDLIGGSLDDIGDWTVAALAARLVLPRRSHPVRPAAGLARFSPEWDAAGR